MMRKNGFTLIEVMISVLILSILASATYELMTQVVDSDIQIREKTERFATVQRAFMLMEKDYTQMAPRMEDLLPSLLNTGTANTSQMVLVFHLLGVGL